MENMKFAFPFEIKSAFGYPEKLKTIDFCGFTGILDIKGKARVVKTTTVGNKTIYYYPYEKVTINEYGFSPKFNSLKRKQLIFNTETGEFITRYETKESFGLKPTELRDLFAVISIADDEEDIKNAQSIIDFLCDKYNTFIFKDLYSDYLKSDGLFLPILVKEVAEFKTKQELMQKFYKLDIKGNWNKKNINLSYIISKLQKKLTPKALARVMQIKEIRYIHIGRNRYKLVFPLYMALCKNLYTKYYYVDDSCCKEYYLIRDALMSEYKDGKIYLDNPDITINRHNKKCEEINLKKLRKKIKFKIKKNTCFKNLIDNMPPEYELLKTPERLIKETIIQKNCVGSNDLYATLINEDRAMIYSTIYKKVRHTIEIKVFKKRGKNIYRLAQCSSSCNQPPIEGLCLELNKILDNINKSA